jgi:hypothetical protein
MIEDMKDTSHLVALVTRLAEEKRRLAAATTANERELRTVWVMQCEREIANERAFLGMPAEQEITISDDDLLAELDGL